MRTMYLPVASIHLSDIPLPKGGQNRWISFGLSTPNHPNQHLNKVEARAHLIDESIKNIEAERNLVEWHFHIGILSENQLFKKERNYHEILRSANIKNILENLLRSPELQDPERRKSLKRLLSFFDIPASKAQSSETHGSDKSKIYTPSLTQIDQKEKALISQLNTLLRKSEATGIAIGKLVPEDGSKTYAQLLVELVKDRNAYAQSFNYRNYYHFRLVKERIKPEQLQEFCQNIEDIVHPKIKRFLPYFESKAFKQKDKALTDLLTRYLRSRDPEEVMLKTASMLGLQNEVKDILKRSDLYFDPKRQGKLGSAATNKITPPWDIRVRANLPSDRNQLSLDDYYTLLHEVIGHALDYRFIQEDLAAHLKSHDRMSTEAQAHLFDSLILDERWLREAVEVPDNTISLFKDTIEAIRLRQYLYDLSNHLRIIKFEKEMYENPDQDLDELYIRTLAEQWQWEVDPLPYKNSVLGLWPKTRHYTSHPADYHNYLFGKIWTAQVREYIIENYKHPLTLETARYLQEQRSSGLFYEWPEKIQRMTGASLKTDPLKRELEALEKKVTSSQDFFLFQKNMA